MNFAITMKHKKDTKHTQVFVDDSLDSPITQLYVHKRAFGDDVPSEIEVEVRYSG